MPPLPNRKTLEAMKRVDLQKICKDYGVRANLKSEVLINLLLNTQSTSSPGPTRRSVLTRLSSRSQPSRVSSMVVHNLTERSEGIECQIASHAVGSLPRLSTASPKVYKAKESQRRLGVGKPIVVGGQGPRAVTRSSTRNLSRIRKISKKSSNSAIEEEEPEASTDLSKDGVDETSNVYPADHLTAILAPLHSSIVQPQSQIAEGLKAAMRPFQDEIDKLRSELSKLQHLQSDVSELGMRISEIQKTQEQTHTVLENLRQLLVLPEASKEEIRSSSEVLTTNYKFHSRPSTPKSMASRLNKKIMTSPTINLDNDSPSEIPNLRHKPTLSSSLLRLAATETILGKRHRESAGSDITDLVEEDECSDSGMGMKIVRPNRKKPRLQGKTDYFEHDLLGLNSGQIQPNMDDGEPTLDIPTFAVFRDSDEPLDPPPPTDQLPYYFPSDTTTPNAKSGVAFQPAEQLQLLAFQFPPVTLEPQQREHIRTFPYPEAPQSPSPARASSSTQCRREYSDHPNIFKTFDFPPSGRSTKLNGGLQDDQVGFVNPEALSQTGKEVENDLPSQLTTSVNLDQPESRRTMYGTELEGDTRFGDFGIEGVATGYWSGRKF